MKSFAVKDIASTKFFSKATYLDSHFILTAPEMPFTVDLANTVFKEWGFTEIFSEGGSSEYEAPKETPTSKKVKVDTTVVSDKEKVEKAEQFCIGFQSYVKSLFTLFPIKEELELKYVAEKIKEVCYFVQENRRFLLRTEWLNNPVHTENQLVSHSVRSTIIAIIIGIALKFQPHRLIELGIGALLHEIGMLRLPQESYEKKKALTEQERKLLYAHPILGFNILKSYDFPLVISLAALEHHERENGTGYPQRKTGEKISMNSKIIAVACSYEAIISSRPHKGAKDGHAGILELLKNEGKQYDDVVVRALVQALSVYPIGLYVLLSDGAKGQVVDVNPENPRYPIVQIIGDVQPGGKIVTIQTSQDGASIVRPLSREEIES